MALDAIEPNADNREVQVRYIGLQPGGAGAAQLKDGGFPPVRPNELACGRVDLRTVSPALSFCAASNICVSALLARLSRRGFLPLTRCSSRRRSAPPAVNPNPNPNPNQVQFQAEIGAACRLNGVRHGGSATATASGAASEVS